MTLKEVQQLYAAHPCITGLRSMLSDVSVHHIYCGGLQASSASLMASVLAADGSTPLFFILGDQEEAGYFYHDLTQILGDEQVLFFPSSFRRAIKYGQKDAANEVLRTEVLSRLSKGDCRGLCIVTYPDAVAEKVVSKEELKDKTLTLHLGERVDMKFVTDLLHSLGFEYVDYVYEPGQYAVRGSLIDVFSFSSEYPFRIDFFGDEVDSLRTFEVETQLSKEKLDDIVIVPDLSRALKEQRGGMVSVLQSLPEDTLIGMKDFFWLRERIHQVHDEALLPQAVAAREAEETEFIELEGKLMDGDEFQMRVLGFRRLEFGIKPTGTPDASLTFNVSLQPLFHKNFDLLAERFSQYLASGYKLFICSDSQKQIDRIRSIFEDRGDDISFTSVDHTLHEGFADDTLKIGLFTDHQIFDRFHKFNLKSDRARSGKVALSLKELNEFQPGDYVVHIDHGVGRFAGLVRIPNGNTTQEVIKLVYQNDDVVFVSIHSLHKISKYKGKEGEPPRLGKLGSGAWEKLKERTKKRVKELAIDLIKLYSERKAKKGFAYSPDSYLQSTLESSFIYEDTPDQIKTLAEVKADMESDHPMDRLICGDVGFGKTEIAIRAAFKAVCDSKQVAVLVPTTVLSMQHYYTFSERLANMPCNIAYINRFKSTKEIKETLKSVKEGKVDILIGTHRILSKDVVFKDLGLLIIDEEQKFGVAAKEKIREMRTTIDTLTMSATPIPRTLQFSLIGARDISVITTPPPNRQPIDTQVHVFDEDIMRDAIQYELDRGGQVFVIHNKIQNIKELAGLIQRLVPKARVAIGHGQMEGDQLEKIMTQFINGEYDVLVSTTIVESGLDIVNANTMIINDAQNFALNVLHQLRGRVGRNNQKAYCYLFIKPWDTLNDQARKRLQAIEQFSDIGSGIHIALRDLDIRGAGDILGADQSGFINEMGYDMYQKILNEAIQEMKDAGDEGLGDLQMADNSALLRRECSLETDIEALFPSTYISNVTERMNLYKELESIRDPQKLEDFRKKITDIFGPMPRETEELMQTIPLRMLAADLHFEKIVLKKKVFHGYFTGNSHSPYFQSDEFGKFLLFMQANHPVVQLKEANHKLVCSIHNIPTFKAAYHWLGKMEQAVRS